MMDPYFWIKVQGMGYQPGVYKPNMYIAPKPILRPPFPTVEGVEATKFYNQSKNKQVAMDMIVASLGHLNPHGVKTISVDDLGEERNPDVL